MAAGFNANQEEKKEAKKCHWTQFHASNGGCHFVWGAAFDFCWNLFIQAVDLFRQSLGPKSAEEKRRRGRELGLFGGCLKLNPNGDFSGPMEPLK
jgi:hypothetical protein